MSLEVLLLPLGETNLRLLKWLQESLQERLISQFPISPPIPLPKSGLNPQRNQYNSRVILNWLRFNQFSFPLLAVADVDLYSPGLNFVFGEAELGGKVAIISLARLNPTFYGLPSNELLLRDRTLKETTHELGHLFGLRHCPNRLCVMHFSNTLTDTDQKGSIFCDQCERRLQLLLQRRN